MRTITPICALVLLTSCNQGTKPPEAAAPKLHIFRPPDDSSPIVISDGSIKVNHNKQGTHFRVHSPKKAVLKLAGYQPMVLGFGCDPATNSIMNPCSAAPPCNSSGMNTSKCQVGVSPTVPAWTLALCDSGTTCVASPPPVQLTWANSDNERILIESKTKTFTVEGNETDGPVLHFATGKMTVARLSMNALTYDFQFSGTLPDLRISYECRASGNNICMP